MSKKSQKSSAAIKFDTWSPFDFPLTDSPRQWMPWDLSNWSQSADAQEDIYDLRDFYNHQASIISQFNGAAKRMVCGYVTYHDVSYPIVMSLIGPYDPSKPSVLIQGGTHGYEPSGVFANLQFSKEAAQYIERYNIFAIACTNPWAFVKDQRWGAHGVDGNRGWHVGSQNQEAEALILFMQREYPEAMQRGFHIHISNHEWPVERDNEFDALKAQRNGQEFTPSDLTSETRSEFFLIEDGQRNNRTVAKAVINSVENVMPILKPDGKGCIYDTPIQQKGVIHTNLQNIDVLFTNASIALTTEIKVGTEDTDVLVNAQVAAIHAALDAG